MPDNLLDMLTIRKLNAKDTPEFFVHRLEGLKLVPTAFGASPRRTGGIIYCVKSEDLFRSILWKLQLAVLSFDGL